MWNTLQLADSKEEFKFIIDEEEVTFSMNDLRIMLKLPQATANNHVEFVEAPEFGTMIKFLNILGHALVIRLARPNSTQRIYHNHDRHLTRDDEITYEFADIVLLSQEDIDTKIDPWSDKERPDESVEALLIQKKGKSVMEASDTPIATPTDPLGLLYLRIKKNSRN
ncbi:hypothetical protein Tco_1009258 [Tanacetum coccineum]